MGGLVQLRLDVDLRTEPISGRVGVEDAEPRAFTGYAGLIAALQSIRSGEPPALARHEGDES